jgi:hypothetical protein
MFLIQQPSMQWVDPLVNRPVMRGKMYFGIPQQDPKIPANRIPVFYYDLLGNLVELLQPVQLSTSGVPIYLDNPVEIYTDQDFSIRVDDASGAQVYFIDSYAVSKQAVNTAPTVAALRNSAGLFNGQQISLTSYHAGLNKGGGLFVWDASSTATDDGGVTFAAAGVDTGRWVRLLDGFVTPEMFGARGDGVSNDVSPVQSAIDFCYVSVVKDVVMSRKYYCGSSGLTDIFDNAGVAVSASDCAVVLRKGVSLIGSGRDHSAILGPKELILVAVVAPRCQKIKDISVKSTWISGQAGAGHGIFTLSTAGGSDSELFDLEIGGVYVEHVASYGIGLQNGQPINCNIHDCETYYTGADGFDLKARNTLSALPESNTAKSLTARRFNMRVDGSSGIDIRGVWQVSDITIKDFGEDPSKSYTGIRFRTKPVVTEPYNKAAAKSTLYGFNIKSENIGTVTGIASGSDDVKINGGTIENITNGVLLEGNANGSATRNVLSAITVIGATSHGYRNTIGTASNVFDCCYAVDCATGFRIEGAGTKLSSCEANGSTPLSVSSGANATTVITPDCKFGNDSQVKFYQAASGRVAIEAVGTSEDIDLAILPKGSGKIRLGASVLTGDAPITRYIEVKDAAGIVRKLAVIN